MYQTLSSQRVGSGDETSSREGGSRGGEYRAHAGNETTAMQDWLMVHALRVNKPKYISGTDRQKCKIWLDRNAGSSAYKELF